MRNTLNTIFEATLRQVVIDELMDEVESVPDNKTLAGMYTISERHENRMNKLFAKEKRKNAFINAKKNIKRVAVVAMILITVCSGVLMIHPQVRAAVAGTVIEWFDKFTKFTGTRTDSTGVILQWGLDFIPEGYEEVERYESDMLSYIDYANGEGGSFTFVYSPAETGMTAIDNEEIIYQEKGIDGITYHIFESEIVRQPHVIYWEDNGYMMDISGYGDIEVLLEVATSAFSWESIQYPEKHWRLSFIPEGYVEVLYDMRDDSGASYRFENKEKDEIAFGYSPVNGMLATNNERVKYYTIEVAGVTYHFFESEDNDMPNMIVWEVEDYRLRLHGYEPMEVLKEMALTIEPVE